MAPLGARRHGRLSGADDAHLLAGRSLKPLLTFLASAALLAGACGTAPRLERPSTDIEEERFREALATLASAEFQGRRPGTEGEAKTVAWLSDQFRRLKLKPLSGDSYLQPVPMIEFTPAAVPTLRLRGSGGVHELLFRRDMVVWSRRDAPAVSLAGSELVFAGFGVVAPELARDDYAGLDVHGRTVLLLAGEAAPVALLAPGQRARQPGYYARSGYKIDEAMRHGAAGVLLLHDPQASGFSWERIVAESAGVHLDRVPDSAAEAHPAIEGWLSADAGQALFAAAGVDYPALRAAASGRQFHGMPLGLAVDAEVRQAARRFQSSNVIGLLPGSRHKDEYIVYTAHWDHFGVQETPTGSVPYPGAIDNASGVAGLLQIARSFTRSLPAPGRSIVFIATTGGEADLAGSAWYVAHPPYPLADTVADLNLDTLHIGGPTRDVSLFGLGQSELDERVRSVAALQGREVHADEDLRSGSFYDSDAFSFAAHGVPTLYAIGGNDDAARGPGWGRDVRRDYLLNRYHRPGDVYDPDWDLRGTVEDLGLYYRVGLSLAQGGRFPNWYRTSEFRDAGGQDRGN